MRTFQAGTDSGFVLLRALITLIVITLCASAVAFAASVSAKQGAKVQAAAQNEIEYRNAGAAR